MRTPFLLVVSMLVGCESAAKSERPAAVPDASATTAQSLAPARSAEPAPIAPVAENQAPAPSAAPSAAPAAPSAEPPTERRPPRPCRVALIGDSLTDERFGGGYVRYLKARAPASRFVNFAKGGAMVNQMRRQLDAMLVDAEGQFTHLVVFGGVNDLYSDETAGRTVAKIEADLGLLYSTGKTRGLRVVAITVAPWGGFEKYYNARRGAATLELNVWILAGRARGAVDVAVDAYALLSCGDGERLCPRYTMTKDDGLHFGKLGHEALGKALYDAEFHACA
jgi:lysophospholipase L1-like esterase